VGTKVGDRVRVSAYKSDGMCYRWWYATVEAVEPERVVVVTPVGHWVEDIEGGWASAWAIRGYYWWDRGYSLLEVYTPDGRLDEVYVNISSPVEIEDGQLRFTDYELDVSRKPPHPARIEDEDEFQEAASKYGYSEAFQEACYEVAREAVGVADGWVGRGMPAFEG
jgi:protein associated with RNAse G/E